MSDLTFKTLHVNTTGLQGFADIVKAEVEQNFVPNVKRVVGVLNGRSAFGMAVPSDDFSEMSTAGDYHNQAMAGQKGGLLHMAMMLTFGMTALKDGLVAAAKAYGGRDSLNSLDLKAVEGLFLDMDAAEKRAKDRGEPSAVPADPSKVTGKTESALGDHAWPTVTDPEGENIEDPNNPTHYGDVRIEEDDEGYPELYGDPLRDLMKKPDGPVWQPAPDRTPRTTPSPS